MDYFQVAAVAAPRRGARHVSELSTARIQAWISRRRRHDQAAARTAERLAAGGHTATAREVWLVFSTPRDGVPAGAFEAELADHLAWVHGLEQEGLVLLSGPLLSGPGTTTGSGVTLLRAADGPAAGAIAEQDPFVRAGLRTFAVHRWRLNEGSLDFRVLLGDNTVEWR